MNAEQERLIALAHHVLRVTRGIGDHCHRLDVTPLTRAEYLLGTLSHGVDFVTLDRAVKDVDAAIAKHGAHAPVVAENQAHSLIGLGDLLQGALQRVAPYRNMETRKR